MILQKTLKDNSEVNNVSNRLTTALFILYLIALSWIILFKLGVQFSYAGSRNVNLVPFGEPFLKGETILNVVIFVPLGIYAGVLFERWALGRKIFFFFLISLIIEFFQFFFVVGIFDSTDIVTNTLGGIIGLMVFKGLEKAFNNRVKAQNMVNIFAVVGTVFMILFLVLLKMNMLPVRYQ